MIDFVASGIAGSDLLQLQLQAFWSISCKWPKFEGLYKLSRLQMDLLQVPIHRTTTISINSHLNSIVIAPEPLNVKGISVRTMPMIYSMSEMCLKFIIVGLFSIIYYIESDSLKSGCHNHLNVSCLIKFWT